jgi:hypothetical protein
MWDAPTRFVDVLVNTVLADTEPQRVDDEAQAEPVREKQHSRHRTIAYTEER